MQQQQSHVRAGKYGSSEPLTVVSQQQLPARMFPSLSLLATSASCADQSMQAADMAGSHNGVHGSRVEPVLQVQAQ